MQFHDQFWKDELGQHRAQIANLSINNDSEEEVFFKAEKLIFYSAFIVRKLIEDTAVTDNLKSRSVLLSMSPSRRAGNPPFLEVMTGPLTVEDNFDLESRRQIRMSFFDLASEIIHSDGFVWDFSADVPEQFLVFSYRNALNRLLWVPLAVYGDVLDQVLNDNPTRFFMSKDVATGRVTRHAE